MVNICLKPALLETRGGSGSFRLLVFIDDSGFVRSSCYINKADKQGNLVILIQALPDHIRKAVNIAVDFHPLGLSFKAWQRIAVSHIGMDKAALTADRRFICIGKAAAAFRILIAAL